ncbi:hypothetical protein A2U01_0047779, partial [Trifolium medium]|nr:hypothetical protein [Trifolium medium]
FTKVLNVSLTGQFNGADHDMKINMKERFRQFVYPETTLMCPPPDQVKTKGSPKGSTKRPSYSQEERSTMRSPSLFEHAEFPHPPPVATLKRAWSNLDQLPLFMHPFIEMS